MIKTTPLLLAFLATCGATNVVDLILEPNTETDFASLGGWDTYEPAPYNEVCNTFCTADFDLDLSQSGTLSTTLSAPSGSEITITPNSQASANAPAILFKFTADNGSGTSNNKQYFDAKSITVSIEGSNVDGLEFWDDWIYDSGPYEASFIEMDSSKLTMQLGFGSQTAEAFTISSITVSVDYEAPTTSIETYAYSTQYNAWSLWDYSGSASIVTTTSGRSLRGSE